MVPTSMGPVAMDNGDLHAQIEAILIVAEEPVTPALLGTILGCHPDQAEAACQKLAADYEAQSRGFILARIAGGYRFQSAPEHTEQVERYLLEGTSTRISPAGLETLAVIAYKQPVSRAQVAEIRGVSSEGPIRTLRRWGLIEETGRSDGPGQAVLYGTTIDFLERLGMNSLGDLPPLEDFVPSDDVVESLEKKLRGAAVDT